MKSILCPHHERVVMNDYTVRFENRVYQLPPPVWPGLRKGKVTIQERADWTMKMKFKGRYLSFGEVPRVVVEAIESADRAPGDRVASSLENEASPHLGLCPNVKATPSLPRSLSHGLIPVIKGKAAAKKKANGPIESSTGPITVHQAAKRSGRTPALPCPLGDTTTDKPKEGYRPPPTHPWRNELQRRTGHF